MSVAKKQRISLQTAMTAGSPAVPTGRLGLLAGPADLMGCMDLMEVMELMDFSTVVRLMTSMDLMH